MNPDAQIGRYQLLGKLASGGMGDVFLARQTGPQGFSKTCALKLIRESEGNEESFIQMFLNEARLAALINHPNVVQIFELGEVPGEQGYYLAMEFIDGVNAKRLTGHVIRTSGAVPFPVVARIGADAAAGLAFAHDLTDDKGAPLNLVHRDVSPENLLVSYTGQVKVLDFGVAKALTHEGHTRAGQLKGKLTYVSPEQVREQPVDRRSDLWSLGVTLYWMLTGMRPFRGDTDSALLHQVLEHRPDPVSVVRPDVPAELSDIVARLLCKDPAGRYPNATETQQALERCMQRSSQYMSNAQLADFMNQEYPVVSASERFFIRSLLQGDAPAVLPSAPILGAGNTPSQSSFSLLTLAGTRKSGQAGPGSPGSEDLEHTLWSPRRRAARLAVGGALGLAAILALIAFSRSGTHAEPQVVAEAPLLPPLAPPPDRAIAPPAPSLDPAVARSPPSAPPNEAVRGDGLLAVRVAPWADVYVDDAKIGTTPFKPVRLRVGRHRLRLVNPELQIVREMTVDIHAAQTSTVKVALP